MDRVEWNFLTVSEFYRSQGCVLLSTEYKNNRDQLLYICSCGREHSAMFKKFRDGQRCPSCAKNEKLDPLEVAKNFASEGCKLLDPYCSFHAKIRYVCVCGENSEISYAKFKSGRRCKKCSEMRKKTFFTAKYGVSNPMKIDHIKERQFSTNLSRYGVKNPLLNSEVREKADKTLYDKYGISHCSQLLQPFSKESQKLFWSIHDKLQPKDREHTYFAEFNKEFESQRPFFKYDYVVTSLKKCIEYNGSAWHPKPELNDDAIGWHIFKPNLTAGEQRDYENLKYQQLLLRGFKILVIWDYEFKENSDSVIRRCEEFLYS